MTMVAHLFPVEPPEPPTTAELLDKVRDVSHARRVRLGLPEPVLTDLLPVVECPVCGCDVSGCTESVGPDGLRRWTQPIHEEWPLGHNYFPYLAGGLGHTEGGTRCLSDAEDNR